VSSPAADPPALELQDLHRHFGAVKAVDGLSLRVPPRETLAIIGPNGAGKTTLFALIAGELPPSSGAIVMAGRPIARLPPHARARLGLGRTFQSARPFAGLTVAENMLAALLIPSPRRPETAGRSAPSARAARERAVREALAEVDLQGFHRRAGVLSQGDRKRLELAMVLARQPTLLLLDEPTAGMGPGERQAIMALLMALAADRRLTVLFSEHHVETVFAHARRVVVMDRGKPIADGSPQVVANDQRVREIYLGHPLAATPAAPSAGGSRRDLSGGGR
jgi:ABC-type branched-subunit amino acid transport system ATPase component